MKRRLYPAVLERGPKGTFGAWFPDFPGCIAGGSWSTAVTMVNTEGHSRVKPSELLRPAAQATSSKPATNRRIQDMEQLH